MKSRLSEVERRIENMPDVLAETPLRRALRPNAELYDYVTSQYPALESAVALVETERKGRRQDEAFRRLTR